MPHIRFVLLALVCSSSIAHAGAIISLVDPHDPGPGGYGSRQIARFDVYAQLDSNSPATVLVRFAQFDVSDTSLGITLTPIENYPETQPAPGPIPFWNFSGSSICADEVYDCGTDHDVDGSISASDRILSIAYTGMTLDPTLQIVLRQSFPTLLGSLEVTMPPYPGKFHLDVLNADETDLNQGAEIRFGFLEELTVWRAQDGEITGGQHTFFVGVPEPASLALLLLGTACLAPKNMRR